MPNHVAKEFRVFGGPGCGKTTYLGRQVAEAVRKYGPDGVAVCSFSNAAAAEIVQKEIPVPRTRVGTLHSFCRRAMGGQEQIAETVPELDEWNKEQGKRAGWMIPRHLDEEGGVAPAGDSKNWNRLGILRNQLVPMDDWPTEIQALYRDWTAWKEERDLVDFTDLIEVVHREGIGPPFPVAVLFADEAQDYTALEVSVVRAWGEAAEYFILAGDDQQALYGFRGATPDVMLSPPLPPERVKILDHSHRLPRAVLDYATAWGDTMSRFQKKEIQPVAEGGGVYRLDENLDAIVPEVKAEIAAGNEVMILAACSYMLRPVTSALRKAGVLYHNPYRPTAGAWNPLRGGVERVRKFLIPRHRLRWRDVPAWFEHLDGGYYPRGAKTRVKETAKSDGDELVTPADFEMIAGIPLPPPDPEWLFERLLRKPKTTALFAFAKTVIQRYGRDALDGDPRVVVGTYHSVKGGQTDVVFMSPGLSHRGAREWKKDPDPTRRMIYVGLTRARRKVVLTLAEPPAVAMPAEGREPYVSPKPLEVPF